MLPRLALLIVVLLAPAAAASVLEQVSGTRYQNDAALPGDASDFCGSARRAGFPAELVGLLAVADDERDFYLIEVPSSRVGTEMLLQLDAWAQGPASAARPDADLYLYEEGCGTYLASSRNFHSRESIRFVPTHQGPYAVLVLLFGAVSDAPLSQGGPTAGAHFGYALRIT